MKKDTKLLLLLGIPLLFSCSIFKGQNDYVIDSTRMGDIKLCDKISKVVKKYTIDKHLRFEGDEGVSWPEERISLNNNEWVLIEASWVDTTRIWRISTNSSKYTTVNGYKIGDNIQKLKKNHEDISYYESEMGFSLNSKSLSFGFSIESKPTDDFYKNVNKFQPGADYLKYLDDNATITEIIIAGDCNK
jgi:hypothetical protein